MRLEDCVRGIATLTDGAWGTEFQKLGAEPAACIDEWNRTRPDAVRRVARVWALQNSGSLRWTKDHEKA